MGFASPATLYRRVCSCCGKNFCEASFRSNGLLGHKTARATYFRSADKSTRSTLQNGFLPRTSSHLGWPTNNIKIPHNIWSPMVWIFTSPQMSSTYKIFEYHAIRDQTPTTIAMRYSTSFSKYISLLRIYNENIPSFVVKELEGDYLKQAGWKQDSLQALFDLEFEPLPMPKVVCRDAGHCLDPKVGSFGREVCWETFLAQLREGGTSLIDPSSLLRDIRQSVLGSKAPLPEVCYSCQLRGRYEEDVTDESGDSPFLFPADAFF
jgi:hypothetical protein